MMPSIRLSLIVLACIAAFADQASAQNSQPEEIYVARSVRETRVPATEFCSSERTGFSAVTEDRFTFRSIALNPEGRMTMRTCRWLATYTLALAHSRGIRFCFMLKVNRLVSRSRASVIV